MAKLSIADRNAKARTSIHSVQSHTPDIRQPQADDGASFASTSGTRKPTRSHLFSTPPPTSPPIPPASPVATLTAGGEMERIRQAMIHDQLAHYQETENRRPDYLRRTKRTLTEADPAALLVDESRERERSTAVGITESPVKGRRLKLFQETSEESFEESLMAGGYGRYVRRLPTVNYPLISYHAAHGGMGSSTSALDTRGSRSRRTLQCRLGP
jgi:hypothetical protein